MVSGKAWRTDGWSPARWKVPFQETAPGVLPVMDTAESGKIIVPAFRIAQSYESLRIEAAPFPGGVSAPDFLSAQDGRIQASLHVARLAVRQMRF